MAKPPIYVHHQLDSEQFPDLAEFVRIWDTARGERLAPDWDALGFFAFPVKWIPFMYLLDVEPDPLNFRFRFIGTAVCYVEGRDFTGQSVDDLQPPEIAPAVRNAFETFLKDPKPTFFMTHEQQEGRSKMGKRIYSGVRVPLSADGVCVNKILVFCHFEQDHADLRDYFESVLPSKYGR